MALLPAHRLLTRRPTPVDTVRDDAAPAVGPDDPATKPDNEELDGAEPDNEKPDGAEPDGTQPNNEKPDGTEPDGGKPAAAGVGAGAGEDRATGRRLAGVRRVARRVAPHVTVALAAAFVLFSLLLPNQVDRLTPGAFLRIPLEGVLGVALLLVLRAGVRRVMAVLAGVGLAALVLVKILDMGFYSVLARPFDPVLDWVLVDDGASFVDDAVGRAGVIGAAVGAVLLVGAVFTLMTLSVLRLTRLVVRHETAATRAVATLGVLWLICAGFDLRLVSGVPVAAKNNTVLLHNRAHQVTSVLADRQKFAKLAASDAFGNTPADQLLAGLRGKDVLLTFVESYGRVAIEDPDFAPEVGAVLDDGTRRLRAAGYQARSAYLTSPMMGSGSWMAHATFLSGLWVSNQQRYRTLVSSDRMTLSSAFQRAGWETVAVVPGVTRAWPEGDFYGFDRVHDSRELGYQGPKFGWSTMPDQYTLSVFERIERSRTDRGPLMAEIPLVTSHLPWVPLPSFVDWEDVGDGSIYRPMAEDGDPRSVVWKDRDRIRAQYRTSIEYSLQTLISYVEKFGDDDLVLVFLGDHQPAPVVTGTKANRDVPITIVARDPAVLDRISGWGWSEGLKPTPRAPVLVMSSFRDQFLTAFGARPTQP